MAAAVAAAAHASSEPHAGCFAQHESMMGHGQHIFDMREALTAWCEPSTPPVPPLVPPPELNP